MSSCDWFRWSSCEWSDKSESNRLSAAPHDVVGAPATVEIELYPGKIDASGQGRIRLAGHGIVGELPNWAAIANVKANDQWIFREGMPRRLKSKPGSCLNRTFSIRSFLWQRWPTLVNSAMRPLALRRRPDLVSKKSLPRSRVLGRQGTGRAQLLSLP